MLLESLFHIFDQDYSLKDEICASQLTYLFTQEKIKELKNLFQVLKLVNFL